MALGALAGSILALAPLPYPSSWLGLLARATVIGVTTIAALLPDADHKTSTVSNYVQFSAKTRKKLRMVGFFLLLAGLIVWLMTGMYGLDQTPLASIAKQMNLYPSNSISVTGLFAVIVGVLCTLLAHLRSLVFSALGILLLYGFHTFDWPWITVFVGCACLILPLVQHRGIIHTPEFAIALSLGLWSFVSTDVWWLQALSIGLITGWWAHLAGDIFGSEGIHSLLAPRIGIALHWFSNGGAVENTISRICWTGSVVLWGVTLYGQINPAFHL